MYVRRLPGESLAVSPWEELARLVLRTIPPEFYPEHFGRSERRRRRPEFDVSNEEKLSEHIRRYGGVSSFFGADYELATMLDIGHLTWLLLHSRSVANGARLASEWFPRLLDRMYYGFACAPDEHEHRNGHEMWMINNPRPAHGWVGRDIGRYVPGLYWLNLFSREFAERHKIDVSGLAARTGADLRESLDGHVLQLYDSPARWSEWSESIDDILFETPGFFSKRRVQFPEGPLEPRELTRIGGEIWKQWP